MFLFVAQRIDIASALSGNCANKVDFLLGAHIFGHMGLNLKLSVKPLQRIYREDC